MSENYSIAEELTEEQRERLNEAAVEAAEGMQQYILDAIRNGDDLPPVDISGSSPAAFERMAATLRAPADNRLKQARDRLSETRHVGSAEVRTDADGRVKDVLAVVTTPEGDSYPLRDVMQTFGLYISHTLPSENGLGYVLRPHPGVGSDG
ncbi:hypothetical protein DVK00_14780 [Haloarcula sp. Atlit-47R]|uniref:hypothetical protein n=1 Tax=Haloarcula sp. Atlit-47R TaxID=2282132 RepID=UPI000EF1F56F|nr:hypothetical protein [Haloarcula sp. Atlit-47R]RLM42338.1 hypothetical protein DVK00_14780 [Haloarcula sp. Atlit-47R]